MLILSAITSGLRKKSTTMKKIKVYQIDAFTKEKFKGNPAGVVLNADDLSEKEMQDIARELNNSETAFILQGEPGVFDLHVRYFTPTVEVPSCGHATIAAMYVYAYCHALPASVLHIKTGAGILKIELLKTTDDYEVIMEQGNINIEVPLEKSLADQVVAALGITSQDIDSEHPVQVVGTGHSKVMIPLKNRETIDAMQPDLVELAKLSGIINCNGYFPFTLVQDKPEYISYGRMFAPAIGINEDPVTGNANGPLGAYLVHHQLVNSNSVNDFEFIAKQGDAMGRPGSMKVAVSIIDRKPVKVKIKGSAIILFKTEIRIN